MTETGRVFDGLTRFDKSAGDFATTADVEADRAILGILRAARPSDVVLTRLPAAASADPFSGELFWTDGSTAYVGHGGTDQRPPRWPWRGLRLSRPWPICRRFCPGGSRFPEKELVDVGPRGPGRSGC